MTRFTHKWKWGGWGWSGIVETIIPWEWIAVDSSNPANPIVSIDEEFSDNEAWQVKCNYWTTLSLTWFTDSVERIFDINSATATLSTAPTTTFPNSTPNNYAWVFDNTRGTTPTGRLIENPIQWQTHLWRFQMEFFGKAPWNNGSLNIIIENPISWFRYVMSTTLQSSTTSGTYNTIWLTIADNESIPSPRWYILKASTSFSDASLGVRITSITRTSVAVSRKLWIMEGIPEWWTIVGDIQNQTDLIELLYSNIDWWTPSSIPVINALYDWWTP